MTRSERLDLIAEALYLWNYRLAEGRLPERLDSLPEAGQYAFLNQAEFVDKALTKADLLK